MKEEKNKAKYRKKSKVDERRECYSDGNDDEEEEEDEKK